MSDEKITLEDIDKALGILDKKDSGGKRDCNECDLYGECDHQGAYKINDKWCYEDSKPPEPKCDHIYTSQYPYQLCGFHKFNEPREDFKTPREYNEYLATTYDNKILVKREDLENYKAIIETCYHNHIKGSYKELVYRNWKKLRETLQGERLPDATGKGGVRD